MGAVMKAVVLSKDPDGGYGSGGHDGGGAWEDIQD